MRQIVDELLPSLGQLLPATNEIIRASNLTIHEGIYMVALEGSRGLKGGFRPDSDVDLSLLVDPDLLEKAHEKGLLLKQIIDTTLDNWKSTYELDTAAVFEKRKCSLLCYSAKSYAELECAYERPDCIGIYKSQKGFHGFVPDIGVQVEKLFPILPIWKRS